MTTRPTPGRSNGTLALDLGRRRVELRDMGRANSPHDTIVWLPEERILFTGDIVVQSPLPFLGASWPGPWVKVLRELETLPAVAIVPGHGPVLRDFSYVRGYASCSRRRSRRRRR